MKKLLSIIMFLIFLCSFTSQVTADDQTKSARIHYSVSAKVTYLQYDGTSTTQKVDVGKTLKEPKHKKRKGYTFQGWKNKKTGKFWNFNDPVEEHLTLVACYKKNATENKITKTNKTTKANKIKKSVLTPKTGDIAKLSEYQKMFWVSAIAGLWLFFAYRKRKKEE